MSISTACIEDERSPLLDFKGGLYLSSGQLSSWRVLNCYKWEGVGYDYHTSHVITLDLSNQLCGEIHPSLFDLQHLQHLDFSWNYFQGISIPPQLSKLQRISFLSLSNVAFGGEVPLVLGNMSSLLHLDLSYNWEFKGGKFDVWAKGLRSLEFLGFLFYKDLLTMTIPLSLMFPLLSTIEMLRSTNMVVKRQKRTEYKYRVECICIYHKYQDTHQT